MFKHIIQMGLRPPEGRKPLSQAVDPFGDRLTQLFSLYVFLYAQHSLWHGRKARENYETYTHLYHIHQYKKNGLHYSDKTQPKFT